MMPFEDDVKAIVEGYLLGQAGSGAMASILYGEVNPSGKLAETFPMRLEDTPAYLNFPGEGYQVEYRRVSLSDTAIMFEKNPIRSLHLARA